MFATQGIKTLRAPWARAPWARARRGPYNANADHNNNNHKI